MSTTISGERTLTLPEGWWLIGLEDKDERVGAVEAIVADAFPDLRDSLLDLFDAIVASLGVLPDAQEVTGPEVTSGQLDASSSGVGRS